MTTRYQLGLVRILTVTSSGNFLCFLLFIISHLLGLVSSPATFQEYSSCFSVLFSESHIHDFTYVGHMQYLYEMTMLSIKSVQYRPNRVMRFYADGL